MAKPLRLYSAIVDGLGEKHRSDAAMMRTELLCLEVIMLTISMLPDFDNVLDALKFNHLCTFSCAWTPHKIAFNGHEMQATAAGANERTDFHILLEHPYRKPLAICSLYHTTNWPEQTFSGRSHVLRVYSRYHDPRSLQPKTSSDVAGHPLGAVTNV